MHPADEIRGIKSKRLSKKRIILGVTGSISATETIKLSRELIRHGAEVIPVMTKSAQKIIHPDSLWFSTGNKPITELTGKTEHVFYCGRVKDPVDLLLICPATANTISKISYGIDDTTVTTFATTAIGSEIPIIIVPAMHLSMYDHKIIQKNIEDCKKVGIKFINPNIEKNKAKMPEIEEIVANVFKQLGKKRIKNKRILIIGGSTIEYIDDVRVITNLSSGKTAISLLKSAFYQGAQVELWYGQSKENPPSFFNVKRFKTISDLEKLISKTDLEKYDTIILCAAISDFLINKKKGKIRSDKNNLKINLIKAPKIISKIKRKAPSSSIIGFKLEDNPKKLKEQATKFLKTEKLDYVVANLTTALNQNYNEIWIYDKSGKIHHKKDSKKIIADFIIEKTIK